MSTIKLVNGEQFDGELVSNDGFLVEFRRYNGYKKVIPIQQILSIDG